MVKDRLNDLIRVRNEEPSDISLEIPEERVPLTGVNLRQTFEKAEVIKEWIESIEQNTEVIRRYCKKIDDISINQRDLNDKIESLFTNNISISNQIQTKLKAFEDDLQSVTSLDAEGRIKNIQYNTLKTRYQNAFKQNATELERFRYIKKQQLKAQIRAKGISVTEDQLLQLIDEKTDVQVFTENILAQTASAKRELQDIEERHQQLLKIETMLGEIRDLFLHMAILVDTQQELIDRVEYQAGMAQNFVEKSRNDLKKGEKLKKRHRKDTQIRKLKLSMEPWRELVLQVNSILLWEKQWHSTGLLAGASFLFTILWLSDPNVLTVISLTGLIITLSDYFLPIILSAIFKSEAWSTEKQKQYEEICTNIILYKTKAELLISSFSRMRVTNPKMYFSITIFILCFLTWLGGTVDNLFLTFVFITFLVMLPGMLHHGMLSKLTETSTKLFNDLIENAKSKVAQKKLQ